MENVDATSIEFGFAVKLLVQAHEREVCQLQQLQKLAPSLGDSNLFEEPSVPPQPSTALAPLSLDCPPISDSCVHPTQVDNAESANMATEVCPGALHLTEDLSDFGHMLSSSSQDNGDPFRPVHDHWYMLVARVLGSYRAPLMPHDIWRSDLSASISLGTPQRPSGRTSYHHTQSVLHNQKRLLKRIEEQAMLTQTGAATFFDGMAAIKHMRSFTCPSPVTSMLHPVSSVRLFWVLLCLFMVSYEILLVTMTPFGIGEMRWAQNVDFVCASFWTLDIGVTFRSGVIINGNKIEMRASRVAKHYVSSWFSFDCAVAAMQWYTVYGHLTNQRNAANSLVALGIVRLLRLGRMSKILGRFNLEDALLANFGRLAHIMIDHLKIGREMAKGLLGAIVFVHCTTCAFYEVGKGPDGWGADYKHLLTGTVLNDYLICMHWSLAQFQGNVDVYPGRSTSARAFACASSCLSIAFLTFFVSTLTGTLVSLRDERKRRLRDVTTMTRFLNRQSMPSGVMLQAARYVNTWEMQEGERMKYEEERKALELFPKGLRRQLMSLRIAPYLEKIPIFVYLNKYHANTLAAICADSVKQYVSSTDEDLFTNCEPAKLAFVVVSGEITYNSTPTVSLGIGALMERLPSVQSSVQGDELGGQRGLESIEEFLAASTDSTFFNSMQIQERKMVVERLNPGDIISEAAIWLQCVHEGDLCCLSICHCLVMCTATAGAIISKYDGPRQICSDYAYRFASVGEQLKESDGKRIFIDLLGAKEVLSFEAVKGQLGSRQSL